jgi:hypothetical protein
MSNIRLLNIPCCTSSLIGMYLRFIDNTIFTANIKVICIFLWEIHAYHVQGLLLHFLRVQLLLNNLMQINKLHRLIQLGNIPLTQPPIIRNTDNIMSILRTRKIYTKIKNTSNLQNYSAYKPGAHGSPG